MGRVSVVDLGVTKTIPNLSIPSPFFNSGFIESERGTIIRNN